MDLVDELLKLRPGGAPATALRIGNRVEFHGMARQGAQYNGLLVTVRCVLDDERFGVEHAGRILSVSSQNLRFVDKGTAVDDTKTWPSAEELRMQQEKRLTNEKARNERHTQQEAQLEEWFGRWWGCESPITVCHIWTEDISDGSETMSLAGKLVTSDFWESILERRESKMSAYDVDADKTCAAFASPSEPEETKTVDRRNTQKKEPHQQDKKKRQQKQHQEPKKQKKAQLKPANGARKKQAQNVGGRCRAPEPAAQRRHNLPGAAFRASLRCLLLLSCYAAPIVGLAPAVKTGFAPLALPSMQAASSETVTPATPRLEFALTSSPYVASSPESLHHALAANFPALGTSPVPEGKAPSNYTLSNLNMSIAVDVSGNPQCVRVQEEAIDARNGKGKVLRRMNHARHAALAHLQDSRSVARLLLLMLRPVSCRTRKVSGSLLTGTYVQVRSPLTSPGARAFQVTSDTTVFFSLC